MNIYSFANFIGYSDIRTKSGEKIAFIIYLIFLHILTIFIRREFSSPAVWNLHSSNYYVLVYRDVFSVSDVFGVVSDIESARGAEPG